MDKRSRIISNLIAFAMLFFFSCLAFANLIFAGIGVSYVVLGFVTLKYVILWCCGNILVFILTFYVIVKY